MARVQLVEHGPPARRALRAAVERAKHDDLLAPVTVVVPSTYTGLGLRRWLAAPAGLVNVRFVVPARLAELVGAPSLAGAGRRPLTAATRAEAVRAVLAEAPQPFAGVAHHSATERSLDAAFRELRRAGDPAGGALEHAAGTAGAVARLYRAFRAATTAFYDEEDLVVAAASEAARAPARRELGHIVLYLPTHLSPAESELVRALDAGGAVQAILGVTGDASVDAPAAQLAARIGDPDASTRAVVDTPPVGTQVLSAPDPEDEVRAVLRRVVQQAEAGTPLHRMAVVYRVDEPYARLVHELFGAAGVPWTGPSIRRLADSTAGRVLSGLLRLPEAEFRRDAVAAWLGSGPVLDPTDGRIVPAARWDTLSRRAGVVRGLEQWHDRLDRYSRAVDADLEAPDDELTEGARLHLESDLEHARRLGAFVDDLGRRLTPPEPAGWAEVAAWARDLLGVYLGGEGRRRGWPEPELEAARRILDALRALEAVAEISARTDLRTFVRALESELEAPVGRVGRFGAGVLAGRLGHVYGGDFDVVYVLGMAEGVFPPKARDDPLLPEGDRAVVDTLPSRAARAIEERRDYLAAIAAAPERVLCFPRADPRAQRKRLPARWLLETAGRLAGRTLGADELSRLEIAGWYHVVPSFEAGTCGPEPAGSLGERDVRSLRAWQRAHRPLPRHPFVRTTPALAAGVSAIAHRASRELTRFDGLVGAIARLHPDAAHPVSPTALEAWATCPFRYLLAHVLRLREVERPEETDAITPLERGSLIHAVLQEFLDSAPPRTSPTDPWTPDERARLSAITERHCAAAEREGLTGRALTWKLERRRIRRELRAFLDTDERLRARLGVVPTADGREVAFGSGGDVGGAEDVTPATLELADGRAVSFRGRIDRVDRAPGGSPVVVFDYKTGRRRDDAEAGLEQGTRLQLPVYALAMGSRYPGATVHAYYWYVADQGDEPCDGYAFDHDHRELFADRVRTILDGIGGGVFPAYPGDPRQDRHGRDTWDNCCYCPFDRVCPTAREQAWEHKHEDPAAAAFLELWPAGDDTREAAE